MFVFSAIATAVLITGVDHDDSLKKRFLNECPAALTRLEDYLSEVQGVAHCGTRGDKVRGAPIEFATDGPRKTFHFSRSVMVKNQKEKFRYVYCLDGPKSFSLRDVGDGSYRLTSVGEDVMVVSTFRIADSITSRSHGRLGTAL
jgi:hypothetical protein